MNFNDLEEIKQSGFIGFKKMSELFKDSSTISNIKGVYFVLYLDNKPPKFLVVGTGGYFKGRNPNVSLEKLESNWVEDTLVVYIGKAGGMFKYKESDATLKSRLKTYFSFGKGNKAAHSGGKYIWQIENSNDLVVCWNPTPNKEPADIETNFIKEFTKQNGKRPFANHKD
jgi:hypothetical protein